MRWWILLLLVLVTLVALTHGQVAERGERTQVAQGGEDVGEVDEVATRGGRTQVAQGGEDEEEENKGSGDKKKKGAKKRKGKGSGDKKKKGVKNRKGKGSGDKKDNKGAKKRKGKGSGDKKDNKGGSADKKKKGGSADKRDNDDDREQRVQRADKGSADKKNKGVKKRKGKGSGDKKDKRVKKRKGKGSGDKKDREREQRVQRADEGNRKGSGGGKNRSSKGRKKKGKGRKKKGKGRKRKGRASCTFPGGKAYRGQSFFKASGCREASVCSGKEKTTRLTSEKDGCAAEDNLVCSAVTNDCECAPGFMPSQKSSNGFIRRCIPRPNDDQVCCKPPFQRSSAGGCFYVSSKKLRRDKAERECEAKKGQLVVFADMASGLSKLRGLKRNGVSIVKDRKFHVGGFETLDENRIARDVKSKLALASFKKRCGSVGSQLSGKKRTRRQSSREKGLVVDFSESNGIFDVAELKRQMPFICERSAATIDTTEFRWSSWVDAKGNNGNKKFQLKQVLADKRAVINSNVCDCPVAVECRFKDNGKEIKFGKSSVGGQFFNKPLTLAGENTILECQKNRNGQKNCQDFQCRVFCHGGTGGCDRNECDEGSKCTNTRNGHKCTRVQQASSDCEHSFSYENGETAIDFRGAKCIGSGDVHYLTLDSCFLTPEGRRAPRIDFQGDCSYRLAECVDCTPSWKVIGTNWKKDKPDGRVSWTKAVRFEACGDIIEIGQGDGGIPPFTVNSIERSLNYMTDCVVCTYVSKYVRCVTNFGVRVSFNGISTVEIILDKRHANGKVNGICGNYNMNGEDDFLMKDGSVPDGDSNAIKEMNLGRQWVVSDSRERCFQQSSVAPSCTPEEEAVLTPAGACGMIKDSNIFAGLSSTEAEQLYESCKEDYCSIKNTNSICEALAAAADQSENNLPNSKVPWRANTDFSCPLPSCGENMEFGTYTCQDTCDSDAPQMCQPESEGCHCKDNFFLSGNKCVPPTECGCTRGNMYIALGKSVIQNCKTVLTCVAGGDGELPSIQETEDPRCKPEECQVNKCVCENNRELKNGRCVDKPLVVECPRGWMKVRNLCIKPITKKSPWVSAARTCAAQADTATLLRLDSERDREALEELVSAYASKNRSKRQAKKNKRNKKRKGKNASRKKSNKARGKGRKGKSPKKTSRGRKNSSKNKSVKRNRGNKKGKQKGNKKDNSPGKKSKKSKGRKKKNVRKSSSKEKSAKKGRGSKKGVKKGSGRKSGKNKKNKASKSSKKSGKKTKGKKSASKKKSAKKGRGSKKGVKKGSGGKSGKNKKNKASKSSKKSGKKTKGKKSASKKKSAKKGRGSKKSVKKGSGGKSGKNKKNKASKSSKKSGKKTKGRKKKKVSKSAGNKASKSKQRKNKGKNKSAKRSGKKGSKKNKKSGKKSSKVKNKNRNGKKKSKKNRKGAPRGKPRSKNKRKRKGKKSRSFSFKAKEWNIWVGGCREMSDGRKRNAVANGIPTSLDLPNFDGLGATGNSGCLKAQFNLKAKTFTYKYDSPQAINFALCAFDPARSIPKQCFTSFTPIATDNGASLTIAEIAAMSRLDKENGFRMCKRPSEIKCFDHTGTRIVSQGENGLTCSTKLGFQCTNTAKRDCSKFTVEICCPETEDTCDLFPNACGATQKCSNNYYAFGCKCAAGYVTTSDGQCLDVARQCLCAGTGDPHFYGCGNFKFDFMGKCRYTAITNDCGGVANYPSIDVTVKHRPCGDPVKQVTCSESLEVKICETKAKKDSNDCIISQMKTWDGVECSTVYDSTGFMKNSISTSFDDKTCYFKGLGVTLQISGSKWSSVIPEEFKGKICGYCGAWNANDLGLVDRNLQPFNFVITRTTTRKIGSVRVTVPRLDKTDAAKFGDAWQVYDPSDPECKRTEAGEDCTDEDIAIAKNKCAYLNVLAALFGDEDIETEMDNCVEDVCKGTENGLCTILEAYVESKALEAASSVDIQGWRKGSPCPITCDQENQQPSNGVTPQAFCKNVNTDTYPDCVCIMGTFFDEPSRKCVPKSGCSCYTQDNEVFGPGETIFDTKNCKQKLTCEDGDVVTSESNAADQATCTKTELTGCKDGFDGDGVTCTESATSCVDGWMSTPGGCVRVFTSPQDFPLAAEKCRENGADLVQVTGANGATLEKIVELLKNEPTGTQFFVSGVCGRGVFKDLQTTNAPGIGSYIVESDFVTDCEQGETRCYVAEVGDETVTIKAEACRTQRKFICQKKPDDEYDWTEHCNGNVQDGTEEDDETIDSMRDAGCEVCQKPRGVNCQTAAGEELDTDDGECSLAEIFTGSECNPGECTDYQVSLLCQLKINECDEEIDLCDDGQTCTDTEYGYRCVCEEGTEPVTRDGETVCLERKVCSMTADPSTNDLSLSPFGSNTVIDYARGCTFSLLSDDCVAQAGVSISFKNSKSITTPKHLIITVGSKTAKLFADGLLKVDDVVKTSVDFDGKGVIQSSGDLFIFSMADNSLRCEISAPNDGSSFVVSCSGVDEYSDCGVCQENQPDYTSTTEIEDFFDANREPGTARCSSQSGSSTETTFGQTTTIEPTTTPLVTTAATTQAETTKDSATGDSNENCDTSPCLALFSTNPCLVPAFSVLNGDCEAAICVDMCTFVNKLNGDGDTVYANGGKIGQCSETQFRDIVTNLQITYSCPSSPSSTTTCNSNPAYVSCTSTLKTLVEGCGDNVPINPDEMCSSICQGLEICELFDQMVGVMMDSLRNNNEFGTCDLAQLQTEVAGARQATGCELPDCAKPRQRRQDDAPALQPTCAQPDRPTDGPAIMSIDPTCVCEAPYVIDETDTGKPCVSVDTCGCYYAGNLIQPGEKFPIGSSCEEYVVCENGLPVTKSEGCASNAECVDGVCKCTELFMGDGYEQCAPIIDFPEKVCGNLYDAEGEIYRLKCNCKMGYSADCQNCVDINECVTSNPCGEGTECVNTPGSYQCDCLPGYKRASDNTCTDIKECNEDPSPCGVNSTCIELKGSYFCQCCAGYQQDGSGECMPIDLSDIPNKCCNCIKPECFGTPATEPEGVCYRDSEGTFHYYDDFRTMYIARCLANKVISDSGWTYGRCTKPRTTTSQTTPQDIPVTTPATEDDSTDPCGDSICTDTPTENDKATGEVCLTVQQKTYPNLCEMKKALCRGNSDTPVTIDPSSYSNAACPTTTPTPPDETEDFKFGEWDDWTLCSCQECTPDCGTQSRQRSYEALGEIAEPDEALCIQIRSCRGESCAPDTTNPTDVEPENCDNIICQAGQNDPVCGKLEGGQLMTFRSECLLKEAACQTDPPKRYTVSQYAECDADEEAVQQVRPCGTPVLRTYQFNTTHNGETCVFELTDMKSCVGLCGGVDGTTSSDMCCEPQSFDDVEVEVIGNCVSTTVSTKVKSPKTCHCVDTSP